MQFLSFSFLALFTVCFILCYALKGRYRNALLLLASGVFVGWFHLPFLITAVVVALYTFFMGQWIEQRNNQSRPVKTLYIVSIVGLIGGWLFFHYSSFSVGVIHSLLPFTNAGTLADKIIVPLGMSFYTFQAIGYLTDIYWQEYRAERNTVNFMLYMLFFMKFLSGPIERGDSMLEQLKNPKPFDYTNIVSGLKLIFLGLFKKLLIANYISPSIDMIFSSVHEISGVQLLMTCLLYPVVLYADFSGYTDIAVGGARMFGIELSPNFDRPFVSKSTSELWRRWHMSLSFWVRDYLYIPLTAATRSWREWGIYLSLIVTFVLLGVWHGAGWAFAFYGFIQGFLICCEMRFPHFSQRLQKMVGAPVASAFMMVKTYLLFAVSLIFFRLSSFSDALYFLRNISFEVEHSWKEMNIGMSDNTAIVAGIALVLVLVYEYLSSKKDLAGRFQRLPVWLRWGVYYLMVFLLLLHGKFGADNFIYLQF